MNYIEELNILESKTDLTSYELEKFENRIKMLELEEQEYQKVKRKIDELKIKLVGSKYTRWDLFLHDVNKSENIPELVDFLNEIDKYKDSTIDKKMLKQFETTYSNVILPILHDKKLVKEEYRDLCIKEVNKKLKVFRNRIERCIDPIFGMKIHELREAKKMTLKDLEYSSGVTSSYIHRIESGDRKPSIGKVKKLAEALDADFEELLSLLNINYSFDEKEEDLLTVIQINNFLVKGKKLSSKNNKILVKAIEGILEKDIEKIVENMKKLKL